jgi:hypothetical protein
MERLYIVLVLEAIGVMFTVVGLERELIAVLVLGVIVAGIAGVVLGLELSDLFEDRLHERKVRQRWMARMTEADRDAIDGEILDESEAKARRILDWMERDMPSGVPGIGEERVSERQSAKQDREDAHRAWFGRRIVRNEDDPGWSRWAAEQ